MDPSNIREEVIDEAIIKAIKFEADKANDSTQLNIQKYENLTQTEKAEAIRRINKIFGDKNQEGRHCEKCLNWYTLDNCEVCIRNYLEKDFCNWTSGNDDIDNLIQTFQKSATRPDRIIEWIPYDNFRNSTYVARGANAEIYKATWKKGPFVDWDSEQQNLKRFGQHSVILKLVNLENPNQWSEIKSHLLLSSNASPVVLCYGLTKALDDYAIVMEYMDYDLGKYLRNYISSLTWIQKYRIINDILESLKSIHNNDLVHRDLHSGNILYSKKDSSWLIGDFGMCKPVNKGPSNFYGNLRYIAPESINRQESTFASDIYSFGMLMWEVSSGCKPFFGDNFGSNDLEENDFELALNIVDGKRPKIDPRTFLEYSNLMQKCWDNDPSKRPSIETIDIEIKEVLKSYYQGNMSEEKKSIMKSTNNSSNTSGELLVNCSDSEHDDDYDDTDTLVDSEDFAESTAELIDFEIPKDINEIIKLKNEQAERFGLEIIKQSTAELIDFEIPKDINEIIKLKNEQAERFELEIINHIENIKDNYIVNQDQVTDIKRDVDNNINVASLKLSTSNDNIKIVIKELKCDTKCKELKHWIKVHKHPNIVKFMGIFRDKKDIMYLMIPHASNGSLRSYYNTNELSTERKLKIAMDITSGIRHLHDNDVIHGNLHSKNILVFDGNAQISDLPLPNISIEFDERLFDNIGYIDPDLFLSDTDGGKPIDVYSLGILLWEIMSEKVPYLDDQNQENGGILDLVFKIKEGKKKLHDITSTKGIPTEYIDLYNRCWDRNRLERPKIEYVYDQLFKLVY